MTRPTMDHVYMQMALTLCMRSTCKRLQVGCVIASKDRRQVLALGYNGGAAGRPDSCDADTGQCGCLHAEENAIISCAAPRHMPKVVFSSHAPCLMCAKRLLNLGGVTCVYFKHDYRLMDGIALLRQAGVLVIRHA